MTKPDSPVRLQLALNVANLDEAVDYYGRLFGVAVAKREPGYANFVIPEPALKLVLFEAPDATERLNHLGVEVFSDEQVAGAGQRLEAAAVPHEVEVDETCCYARQNKVVSFDPQGLMWEWYRVLEDSPTFFEAPVAAAEQGKPSGCC